MFEKSLLHANIILNYKQIVFYFYFFNPIFKEMIILIGSNRSNSAHKTSQYILHSVINMGKEELFW